MNLFATHRNWKEQAAAKQSEVSELQRKNNALVEEIERNQSILSHERAARASAVTSLQSQLTQAETQVAQLRTQVDRMEEQRAVQLAAVNAAQTLVQKFKDDNGTLQVTDAIPDELRTVGSVRTM